MNLVRLLLPTLAAVLMLTPFSAEATRPARCELVQAAGVLVPVRSVKPNRRVTRKEINKSARRRVKADAACFKAIVNSLTRTALPLR